MNIETITIFIFMIINIGTYIFVLYRLESKNGFIYAFPIFLVFGFVIAFILIGCEFDGDNT